MGKHYTFVPVLNGIQIRENKNRVLRRHYTIANCMQKDFYRSLVEAVTNKGSFDTSLLDSTDCESVFVGIKTYNLNKGVSKRVFDFNEKHSFEIKGPMGRGLGLTNKSVGHHIAFSAGTGIFVYIDLIARIALGLLGAIPKEE